MKRLRKLLCKILGHKWETYVYQYGMYPSDIEMAGHCKRCGADTHQ